MEKISLDDFMRQLLKSDYSRIEILNTWSTVSVELMLKSDYSRIEIIWYNTNDRRIINC